MHADGRVGICRGEVIIYSCHAYRWPSWDIHKWSQYILNSRMQIAQLGYTQVKSIYTQLTHADVPDRICTGEVIMYSAYGCRWPSWDMHKLSHYLLNSRMHMAQLRYAQEKSLSTQLTHADGPVGICTGKFIIYSTHACRWPSWDMHRRSHYLLNSRKQMAQLGYAQVKSLSTELMHAEGQVGRYTSEPLSTQLAHADGLVGICTNEVSIYSTHACR